MMQGENPKEKPTDFRLSISRGKAEAVLEDFLKNRVDFPGQKAKDWLQDLLKHYLIQTGADREQIEFHHQLFQEYYAAEYLRKLLPSLSDAKLKRDYLNLLKWTEPLALMLGLVEDEAQAVRVVQLALDVDLMLGARLAGEVKQEFQEKSKSFIEELKIHPKHKDWFSNILPQTVPDVRQKFEEEFENAMLESGGYVWEVVSYRNGIPLMECRPSQKIGDEKNDKSGSVVYEDRKSQNEALIISTVQDLKNQDFIIRFNAVQTLEKIANETIIYELSQAFNDECFIVRMAVTSALGEIGSDKAICTLHQALIDKNLFVRITAINALFNIGTTATVGFAEKERKAYILRSSDQRNIFRCKIRG
ncbi:HEAT repeat domain-containing protein [[Scytonema hofmanni] UTEX B 1581]|uniref:HEAT repeat domain-containing protein n=1 Tax=[Scytonema hofmanni] UTEX B 1581 TaxID=379535 RepID=UPI000570FEF6|nr:HEAT repeat domain-containing protein [[Scytonema hofmanni] UTEX B 1581]